MAIVNKLFDRVTAAAEDKFVLRKSQRVSRVIII
jgi:hypothetical protein